MEENQPQEAAAAPSPEWWNKFGREYDEAEATPLSQPNFEAAAPAAL